MSSYLIKYRDDQISVFEYCDTQLTTIRNKGEESWEYQGSSFWDWFKEKIEYEDEELSFIVLCDEEFNIDSSIKLSSKHHLCVSEISDFIYEFKTTDLMAKTFPDVDLKIKIEPKNQKISAPINTKTIKPHKKSLQSHFKNQTAKYKG